MTTKDAGRFILDSIQRHRMGDLSQTEMRAELREVRDRCEGEADYLAAKAWAVAREPRTTTPEGS